MKEMGGKGKCVRYRELKYEKKNYITLGFRQKKINAAAAEWYPLSIQMPEGCAVGGTENKKGKSLSKKLVLPHRTDTPMDVIHRRYHFVHSHSKMT